MKHILAILALAVAFVPQPANAQIDKSPGNWGNYGTIPNGSPYFKYPATPPEPPAPAMKPPSLPPVEYDRKYTGQLIVNKMNDYSLIRDLCKETVNAIACSYHSHEAVSGKPISCLIMLGPAAWNDDRALRHEIGHCNGWSDKHEGTR